MARENLHLKVYKSNRFGLGALGRTPQKPPRPTQPSRSSERSKNPSRRERFDTALRSKKKGANPSPKTTGRSKGRRPLATLLSVVMVLAGLGVVGYSVFGGSVVGIVNSFVNPVEVPQETEMTLTVPKLSRVEDDPVYTAAASDTATLDAGATHVEGTGFPWDQEANVYIAAHRLGYAGTESFLQFYDLNKLRNGDEIFLTDANGNEYTYTVFNKMRVDPTDAHVLDATPGKNIVSLQTCTLPDYSQRLIVQGELTSVA
ncbi:MAG: class E sortase [Rubrobacter sp.]